GVQHLLQGSQRLGGGHRRVPLDELHRSGHLVVTASRGRPGSGPSVRHTTVTACQSCAPAPASRAAPARAATGVDRVTTAKGASTAPVASPTVMTGSSRGRASSRSSGGGAARRGAEPNAAVQVRNERILTSIPLTARPTK